MSTYEAIIYEKSEHRATITLNRPEARNGITQQMLDELYEAVQDAAADKSLRVLVLRGAGRDFCPGADVKHYAAGKGGRSNPKAFHVSTILHEAPVVTIAAIKGACAGAGLGWAAACDLRVCDDTARFNSAFLGVGISGDMGGPWTLPRIVGAAKARELYFLSDRVSAEEALRLGLTNWVCEPEELQSRTREIARRLAAGPTVAYRYMKENLNRAMAGEVDDCLDLEATHHVHCGQTQDHREATKAFVEKREPVFVGR